MGALRSSSFSYFTFSSYSFLLSLLYTTIYSFLLLPNVNSFHPVIHQFPTLNNITGRSRTLIYVNEFGAKGDGITDDTKSFHDVWKIACSSPLRPKIVIPSGYSFLVRPIDFVGPCRSKVSLSIAGSIVAPKDPQVWDGLNPHKWLYFFKVKYLTVEGGGTVNGMGQKWWSSSCKINTTNPCRHAPTAMTFHKCNNLKVRDIRMLNSQQMHISISKCIHVEVSHLIVQAPAKSPNTDGIHISSSIHVGIRDSSIGTGDDCISIVGNSSRILVKNIACGPGHGISIGSLGKSNSWSQVHDVSVDGAYLSNTENGVRIKTWQGGSGFVRKIAFANLWMENVSNPIIIDQYYCDSRQACPNQTLAISINSVSFVGIRGSSATKNAITFACSDSSPCRNLYLEDIQLVSFLEFPTTSFCWNAYGSTSGLNNPSSCFPSGETIIQLPTELSNLSKSI
ncbi:probable polygalacturonase At1g80170 [Nicotiana sylvestris]|uniref:endo-polygalacturonase n=1 Tax=Nicotiana sylvestris TaxID=4096 RepID=A0A1U7Y9Z0_NICSY|nr:PREDICTED: probable polygalacturonase At1g80170 [Nicotiana sylvestris]